MRRFDCMRAVAPLLTDQPMTDVRRTMDAMHPVSIVLDVRLTDRE